MFPTTLQMLFFNILIRLFEKGFMLSIVWIFVLQWEDKGRKIILRNTLEIHQGTQSITKIPIVVFSETSYR